MECETATKGIYEDVIRRVIDGVRELFVEEGIDEQVLKELKEAWERKLLASNSMPETSELENQIDEQRQQAKLSAKKGNKSVVEKQGIPIDCADGLEGTVVHSSGTSLQGHSGKTSQQRASGIGAVQLNQLQQQKVDRLVRVQIALPPGGITQQLIVHVPTSALEGNRLQNSLFGAILKTAMDLPAQQANQLVQRHVDQAFIPSPNSSNSYGKIEPAVASERSHSLDGAEDSSHSNEMISNRSQSTRIVQLDGETVMTDEESADDGKTSNKDCKYNDNDDDDDDVSDDDDSILFDEDEGPDEEPLNSDDDITDEERQGVFDTDNLLVCQYDKVSRSRNRWKFHFKDGIMTLNGRDYLFQKAIGEAEW